MDGVGLTLSGLSLRGECPSPGIHGYPPAERLATITIRMQFTPLTAAEIEAYVAPENRCNALAALHWRGVAVRWWNGLRAVFRM